MHDPDAVTFAALLKRQRLAAGEPGSPGRARRAQRQGRQRPGAGSRTSPRLATVALLADALGAGPEQRAELLAAARPARPGGHSRRSGGRRGDPRRAMPRPLTPRSAGPV